MTDRGETSASRKAARALPLTHRQHKSNKRNTSTQPETSGRKRASASKGTAQSVSLPKKATAPKTAAPRAPRKAPQLVKQAQPSTSAVTPPRDLAEVAAVDAITQMDTTQLTWPPAALGAAPSEDRAALEQMDTMLLAEPAAQHNDAITQMDTTLLVAPAQDDDIAQTETTLLVAPSPVVEESVSQAETTLLAEPVERDAPPASAEEPAVAVERLPEPEPASQAPEQSEAQPEAASAELPVARRVRVRVRRKLTTVPLPAFDLTRQDTVILTRGELASQGAATSPTPVATPAVEPSEHFPSTMELTPAVDLPPTMRLDEAANLPPTMRLGDPPALPETTKLDEAAALPPTMRLSELLGLPETMRLGDARDLPAAPELPAHQDMPEVEQQPEAPAADAPAVTEPEATTPSETPVEAPEMSAPEMSAPAVDAPAVDASARDVEAETQAAHTPQDEQAAEAEQSIPTQKSPKMPTLAVMAALATARLEPAAPIVEPLSVSEPAPDAPALEPPAVEAPIEAASTLEAATSATPASDEAPTSAAGEPAQSESADDDRHGAGIAGMWWPRVAWRQPTAQTPPIAASAAESPDDDLETTAPRIAPVRRAKAQPAAAPAAAESSALRDVALDPFARDLADLAEPRARRLRDGQIRRRSAIGSPRAVVLTWTAGAHAGVASFAALIAVIALMRTSAGSAALSIFDWAIALTLIAGLGAAIGLLSVQMGRLSLATVGLLVSQVAAFGWALALLGPRAALLALAPASAALALRGIGRASAVATGFVWMALFILDEALTITGTLSPALALNGVAAALIDVALPLVGIWLTLNILISLYASRMRMVAHGRALEHAALLTEAELARLRRQVEDDADALRRALADVSQGEQPERVTAHGALSVVGDMVNDIADRLIDLRYDRAERKRLESATRRLTRVIERAWLGLSWTWPDATGTILDDLLALLRTPPPTDLPELLDEPAPTGHMVAPHLFRGWQPTEPRQQIELPPTSVASAAEPPQPGAPSQPSQPSLPSLWPSDPAAGLIDPLELPPAPRWRSYESRPNPDSQPSQWPEPTER